MYGELQTIWKELVWLTEVLSRHLSGGTEENRENLAIWPQEGHPCICLEGLRKPTVDTTQGRLCPGLDSNLEPSK
jgi:hypothetical protein